MTKVKVKPAAKRQTNQTEDKKIKEYCAAFVTEVPKTREDYLRECTVIVEAVRIKFWDLFEKILLTKVSGSIGKAASELSRSRQEELKAKFCKVTDAMVDATALIDKLERVFKKHNSQKED